MDVELVLSPDDGRVHEKCDRIAVGLLTVRTLEERARSPGGVEIVRRLGRPQERVLNALHPPGGDENRVVHERRTQDDIAERLAAGNIDLKARKWLSRQLEVGDAGAHDLPQHHPMEFHRVGREARGQRENGNHCKDPYCFSAARHGLALRIALSLFYELPARLA